MHVRKVDVGARWVAVETLEKGALGPERVLRVFKRESLGEIFNGGALSLKSRALYTTSDFAKYSVLVSQVLLQRKSDSRMCSLLEGQQTKHHINAGIALKLEPKAWPQHASPPVLSFFCNSWSLLLVRRDLHLMFFPQLGELTHESLQGSSAQAFFLRLPGPLGHSALNWQRSLGIDREVFSWYWLCSG